MGRAYGVSLWILVVVGCQLPPEQLPPPRPPLPPEAVAMPYHDLIARARGLAREANEAFYRDHWNEVAGAAKGLEETARFLGKATDAPARLKESLPSEAEMLATEAIRLGEAARAQNVEEANAALQRINLKVRELRPD